MWDLSFSNIAMSTSKSAYTALDVLVVLLDKQLLLENSAVFQSQVGEQFYCLQKMGIRCGILCAVRNPIRFKTEIGNKLEQNGVVLFCVPDKGWFKNVFNLAFKLNAIKHCTCISKLYVRGLWGPLVIRLAFLFIKLPYIYDVRGALADESLARGRHGLRMKIQSFIEYWGIKHANNVTTVSNHLANQLKTEIKLSRVRVIPSCVPGEWITDSQNYRKTQVKNNTKRILLVYSGGLSHYQQLPTMLSLWKTLLSEPDVDFLLLTNQDLEEYSNNIFDLSIFGKRLIHKSARRSLIPELLSRASIGFMLRDSRELNKAASPVKFAEYLASGLSVVASPGTGDISQLVKDSGVGVIVDPRDSNTTLHEVRHLISQVRSNPEFLINKSYALARSKYIWNAYESIYNEIYKDPLK